MRAPTAPLHRAHQPDPEGGAGGPDAEGAVLGLEFALHDHFEDLLVGDAGTEDEGALADAG